MRTENKKPQDTGGILAQFFTSWCLSIFFANIQTEKISEKSLKIYKRRKKNKT